MQRTVPIIKRYHLSNVRIRKNFMQRLSSFMSMCSKYTVFNFGSMHCTFSKVVLHFLLSFFNKMVADASYLRKNGIDWSFHLNQQRKSRQFWQELWVSETPYYLCVCPWSGHGEGTSCQVCHIFVSCQLLDLVIEYNCLNSFSDCMACYCLYSSNSALVNARCQCNSMVHGGDKLLLSS